MKPWQPTSQRLTTVPASAETPRATAEREGLPVGSGGAGRARSETAAWGGAANQLEKSPNGPLRHRPRRAAPPRRGRAAGASGGRPVSSRPVQRRDGAGGGAGRAAGTCCDRIPRGRRSAPRGRGAGQRGRLILGSGSAGLRGRSAAAAAAAAVGRGWKTEILTREEKPILLRDEARPAPPSPGTGERGGGGGGPGQPRSGPAQHREEADAPR